VKFCLKKGNKKRDSSGQKRPAKAKAPSEVVTLLATDDFFAFELLAFSMTRGEKSKKSQALRMTTRVVVSTSCSIGAVAGFLEAARPERRDAQGSAEHQRPLFSPGRPGDRQCRDVAEAHRECLMLRGRG